MQNGLEIAVIGMACKFPGADNVDAFWFNLKNGVESISFFTDEELLRNGVIKDVLSNPQYVKAGSFIQGKKYFDNDFFGYRPDEARLMDPQMRILHELVWHAFEDAGYDISKYKGRVGLFTGATSNVNWEAYSMIVNQSQQLVDDFSAVFLRNIDYSNSRISYLLDLKGPSLALSSACSTSLVAIHQACNSLLLGECSMSVAGGITVRNFSPRGYMYQDGLIESKDGHCRPFDADASGTISGEGGGVVVLRRLKDAIENGDNILAVIKGTGINNDGSNKVGYAAPGVAGQSQAIRIAHSMAKVESASISYIEAHGTATQLGDAIEVEALRQVFGHANPGTCAIGSVKANIGHLDSAAGIAGFIKTVLALQHKQIPPHLNFKKLNAKIDLARTPFYVSTRLQPWTNNKFPLRAGVSSFGIGGTNSHIILEEAPVQQSTAGNKPLYVLLVSGKTKAALDRNAMNIGEYLKGNEVTSIADVAFTLQQGRSHFPHRSMVVCDDINTGAETLINGTDNYNLYSGKKPTVIFMFPGQGSQYPGMCRDLYHDEPVFRQELDRCFDFIQNKFNKNLRELIFSDSPAAANAIDETENTQPILFSIEYALSKLLMSVGVRPEGMIGHSIGEFVSACIGEVFSLEDALTLVVRRGQLMQSVERGNMLSIIIDEESLLKRLEDHKEISIAAINSSEHLVVSGPTSAVEKLKRDLDLDGIKSRVISTSHAFHSSMMDGIIDLFRKEVAAIKIRPQGIQFISNVTGRWVTESDLASPDYWTNQLQQKVNFAAGIELISKNPNVVFVEVGPGRALKTFVQSNKNHPRENKIISLVRYRENTGLNDSKMFATALGELWLHGIVVDWTELYEKGSRRKIRLPGYSFEKVEFPTNVDAYSTLVSLAGVDVRTTKDFSEWFYVPTWKKATKIRAQHVSSSAANMVFVDDNGIAEGLINELNLKQEEVFSVRSGTSFKKITANSFEIDPLNEQHYFELFATIVQGGKTLARILHCWSLDNDIINEDMDSRTRRFYSVVNTARSAAKSGAFSKTKVVFLTNNLLSVFDNEPIVAEKSLSAAFLKVAAQEFPLISTCVVDICIKDAQQGNLSERLCAELSEIKDGEIRAIRSNQTWIQIADPIKVEGEHYQSFRKKGVYLITGGSGAVGGTIAGYLSKEYDATVVLLGRKLKLPGLELFNGNVHYSSTDITTEETLDKLISQLENTFGKISGVVHAAGVINGASINTIANLSKQHFEEQFAPKVDAIKTLRKVFEKRSPDFVLVTSSLSSFLGGLRFGAYAPANAYMDSYVESLPQAANSTRWICINLDGLQLTSNENNPEAINAQELLRVIETCLSFDGVRQVIVSKTELQPRLDQWINKLSWEEEQQKTDGSSSGVEKIDSNEALLLDLWRKFFGMPGIRPTDNFFEVGGDSLKVLTLIGRVHRELGVELSVDDIFQNPTVRQLAELANTLPGKRRTAHNPLPKASAAPYYKVSSSQRRQYFLNNISPQSTAYNLPQFVELEGEIDTKALIETFRKIIQRHESLRTSFDFMDDEPVQKINNDFEFDINVYDGSENDISKITASFVQPFSLEKAPLFRVGLINVSRQHHILMLDMHHIITDGVSQEILIREFMSIYRGESLPPLNYQYKDFSEWQHSEVQLEKYTRSREFWMKEFSGEIPVLDLPLDHRRPAIWEDAGASMQFMINHQQTSKLKSVAEKSGSSLFMVLLSVYIIVLSKLSGQKDIVVGSPVAGRAHSDLENIIGMFINTVTLRNTVDGDITFSEFLQSVRSRTIRCLDNSNYPYELLVDDLQLARDAGRNPLFDVMLAFQNFKEAEFQIPFMKLKPYKVERSASQLDLSLTGFEYNGELYFEMEYSSVLFRKETIDRFIGYFRQAIDTILLDPDIKLSNIGIITPAEKHQILNVFNATDYEFNEHIDLLQLFDHYADINGANQAVVYEDKKLSYEELKLRSFGMADFLRRSGIGRNEVVMICMEKSVELIEAVFGSWRALGAFVPIPVTNPDGRITGMIRDVNPKVVITDKANSDRLTKLSVEAGVSPVFFVFGENQYLENVSQPGNDKINGDDLAYLIYTSGTTGIPKGVAIRHKEYLNLISSYQRDFRLGELTSLRLLQLASQGFDVFLSDVARSLLAGGTMVICPDDKKLDLVEVTDLINKERITILESTPAMIVPFMEHIYNNTKSIGNMELLIVGSDLFKLEDYRLMVERYGGKMRIMNTYGVTEATVDSSFYEPSYDEMPASGVVPIGKPMSNMKMYVLCKDGNLQPVGVLGEIYIGGKGVGAGYLKQPELTNEKFVNDVFNPGGKMYRTGDMGKWDQNGNIHIAGRSDDQVKIRGYRIETGEIESRLLEHEHIREVRVVARARDSDKYLIAYYVSKNEIDKKKLKDYIKEKLPDYMVPSFFVFLEEMPLTPNGKIDTSAFVEAANISFQYIAPSGEMEERLVQIWSDILKMEKTKISVGDNFFELGGHSLSLIKLTARMRDVFKLPIPIRVLYQVTNIRDQVAYLKNSTPVNVQP
jgi:iturin family lipopeptide synthetase A